MPSYVIMPEMQKEQLQDFLLYGKTPEQVQILESFLIVLANNNTIYFFDLDGTITNSPDYMIKRFNLDLEEFYNGNGNDKGFKKYSVTDFDRYKAIEYWAKENGMSDAEAESIENRWYEGDPLLASNPYLLAIPILKRLVNYVGEEKVKTLTAREPHLTKATQKWHKRWFPFVKPKNILIREDNSVNKVEFKVQTVIDEAMTDPEVPVVVIEDSEENTGAIMERTDLLGLKNVYCILMPLGQAKPTLKHERVLTLLRDPIGVQDINSLYEVISNNVAQ